MNVEFQKKIIELYQQFRSTDKTVIKANLIDLIDSSKMNHTEIAIKAGLSKQTIYQLKKIQSNYIPDFITTLVLCNILNVSITDLFKPNHKEFKTWDSPKWDITAKQQFCNDYNSLTITELTIKYSITPRTAQEYYKNFKLDLGI